jgi:hypothetical protein
MALVAALVSAEAAAQLATIERPAVAPAEWRPIAAMLGPRLAHVRALLYALDWRGIDPTAFDAIRAGLEQLEAACEAFWRSDLTDRKQAGIELLGVVAEIRLHGKDSGPLRRLLV